MVSTEVYKTAHTLLVKHGDSLFEALEEKLINYTMAKDEEAIHILGHIRTAAMQLLNAANPETVH